MKLDFVQKVADQSNGLVAKIAGIALENNHIDQLMDIFHEQHSTNPDLFKKMIGNEVYSDYLEVVKLC